MQCDFMRRAEKNTAALRSHTKSMSVSNHPSRSCRADCHATWFHDGPYGTLGLSARDVLSWPIMRATHAGLVFLLTSTTLVVATACGGTVVIDGAGGSGGSIAKPTTATGKNPTTTTATGIPTGNACEIAAAKIVKKTEACNIVVSTGPGGTSGSPPCDASAAQGAAAVAACYEAVSCDALIGKDTAGAQAFQKCLAASAGGGTAAVGATSGSGG